MNEIKFTDKTGRIINMQVKRDREVDSILNLLAALPPSELITGPVVTERTSRSEREED